MYPVPPHQAEKRDHVGGQANHKHDGVCRDADDLSLSKLHVIWQTEVGLYHKILRGKKIYF